MRLLVELAVDNDFSTVFILDKWWKRHTAAVEFYYAFPEDRYEFPMQYGVTMYDDEFSFVFLKDFR